MRRGPWLLKSSTGLYVSSDSRFGRRYGFIKMTSHKRDARRWARAVDANSALRVVLYRVHTYDPAYEFHARDEHIVGLGFDVEEA